MKINKSYLHLFRKSKNCYLYEVTQGIYLCFNEKTLEYEDVVYFFLPKNEERILKKANKKLNNLYSRGILE